MKYEKIINLFCLVFLMFSFNSVTSAKDDALNLKEEELCPIWIGLKEKCPLFDDFYKASKRDESIPERLIEAGCSLLSEGSESIEEKKRKLETWKRLGRRRFRRGQVVLINDSLGLNCPGEYMEDFNLAYYVVLSDNYFNNRLKTFIVAPLFSTYVEDSDDLYKVEDINGIEHYIDVSKIRTVDQIRSIIKDKDEPIFDDKEISNKSLDNVLKKEVFGRLLEKPVTRKRKREEPEYDVDEDLPVKRRRV